MDVPRSLDSLFENKIKNAEAQYIKNPHNSENLTIWGQSLIELSRTKTSQEKIIMNQEATVKLEEAIGLNPNNHKALQWLGHARVSLGMLTRDPIEARIHFDNAVDCFQKALHQVPSSRLYQSSLEVALEAPVLHARGYGYGIDQQESVRTAGTSSSSVYGTEAHKLNVEFRKLGIGSSSQ